MWCRVVSVLLFVPWAKGAWSFDRVALTTESSPRSTIPERALPAVALPHENISATVTRRRALVLGTCFGGMTFLVSPHASLAYVPDPDKLRESLYLLSRVQEATVQQERLASNGKLQEDLKSKMKLSLRLVEKSYRILDQINYASQFVKPSEEVVTATVAGYAAAEALQSAIDFVQNDLTRGPVTADQRDLLVAAMRSTRHELSTFLFFMPPDTLAEARLRVERENVDNRDEFDGSDDAGIYNPVRLPWK
jgi:hypothetical protein